MRVAPNVMCQTKSKTMPLDNKPTKLSHSKSMHLLYWGISVLLGLLAWFYYSVDSPTYILVLVFVAGYVYQLARIYWYRTQNSHALTLHEDYIQAPSALVSKYVYPIAWQNIDAIIWTKDKNKAPTEFLLILLNDRTKCLGEITDRDIKKARKRSKKLFVSGSFDDEDFKSEEARELNYHYLLNSVIFDLSFIAIEDDVPFEKIQQLSGGKLYGMSDFEGEAKDLTHIEARQMMKA